MAVKHKPHLTQQAHALIQEHFTELSIKPKFAIDATCGNGFDTIFLAELISEKVFAFDIQEIALKNTQEKLHEQNLEAKVELIKSGHESLLEYIKKPTDIIMFNFGYLPQADKSITTLSETSLKALDSALNLLAGHGILSLLCYPGHAEGKSETMAIRETLIKYSEKFIINEYLSNYPNEKSPVLIILKNNY